MDKTIELDMACENLRKALLIGKAIPSTDEIKNKWKELYKMGSVQTRKAREIQNKNGYTK